MSENIFNLPENIDDEIIEILQNGKNIRIERILSAGQSSSKDFWYDQDENEWVLLIQGEAQILFENESVVLKPGDHILIPAHRRHRVERTSSHPPCIWICVFFKK